MPGNPWAVGLSFFAACWSGRALSNTGLIVYCTNGGPSAAAIASVIARNIGQGVLWEYWDYVRPSFWMMFPMFLVSLPAGIGWLVGCNVYAVFSAYAHQLQHDNPLKCFWMPMPTHYVHHKFNMWHSILAWRWTFGIESFAPTSRCRNAQGMDTANGSKKFARRPRGGSGEKGDWL